jgi:dihydroflavonol-4-reductase
VRVRVLALPNEATDNVDGLDVEIIRGNVLDIPCVERAVQNVDVVFHAAAIYKDWAPNPTLMYDVNLSGTFNVLEASRRAGVGRVVYTASIVAIGRPEAGALADENTPFNGWDIDFPYVRSKYHSRVIAEDFARWGLDVRVVCPGIVLGPGDIAPTPSGKLIVNTLRLGTAFYTEGGGSYVDVRDAAKVHVLAAERGKAGERYLATMHNLSNRAFIGAVFAAAGAQPKMIKIPLPLVMTLARALDQRALRRGTEPLLASAMVEYSEKPLYFTNRKVVAELGATFRSLDETLQDAIAYFRERGLIRAV